MEIVVNADILKLKLFSSHFTFKHIALFLIPISINSEEPVLELVSGGPLLMLGIFSGKGPLGRFLELRSVPVGLKK